VLCRPIEAAALVQAGHAHMHFVALPHRERGGNGRSFKGGFLGGLFAVDFTIMQDAPLVVHRNNGVLSESHDRSPIGWAAHQQTRELRLQR
jgi:hypothetical protein